MKLKANRLEILVDGGYREFTEKEIVSAIEKQIPKKPINTMREIVCPTCRTLVFPCNVGDKVKVKACCECVIVIPRNDECRNECPFEDDCEFEECDNGNEKLFETSIDCIFNNGCGWKCTFKHLAIEADLSDIGTSFFLV